MSSDEWELPEAGTPPRLWWMRGLAAIAVAISGYLLIVAWTNTGPAGCGAGSGCSEVLTSRWSRLFGLPVSGLALPLHLAALAALFAVTPSAPIARRRLAWAVLMVAAGLLLTGAAWFVGLQLFAVKAFCPWCLADHTAGALLGLLILTTPRHRPQADDADDEPELLSPFTMPATACLAGMGLSLGLMFAALQLVFPAAAPAVQRMADAGNSDTGPGPERRIAVLKGQRTLVVSETPRLGSGEEKKLVIVLFDYCCKYCRQTHGYLSEARARYGDQLGVLLLPMPMNANCNPTVVETEPRFEHACEIARLALAVWRASPESFAEYDAWLFAPEDPRDPDQARAKAEELAGAARLATALKDPWIDEQIRQNVEAYANSGIERIPVLLSPGLAAVVGRPESAQALFRILESELGMTPNQ